MVKMCFWFQVSDSFIYIIGISSLVLIFDGFFDEKYDTIASTIYMEEMSFSFNTFVGKIFHLFERGSGHEDHS